MLLNTNTHWEKINIRAGRDVRSTGAFPSRRNYCCTEARIERAALI